MNANLIPEKQNTGYKNTEFSTQEGSTNDDNQRLNHVHVTVTETSTQGHSFQTSSLQMPKLPILPSSPTINQNIPILPHYPQFPQPNFNACVSQHFLYFMSNLPKIMEYIHKEQVPKREIGTQTQSNYVRRIKKNVDLPYKPKRFLKKQQPRKIIPRRSRIKPTKYKDFLDAEMILEKLEEGKIEFDELVVRIEDNDFQIPENFKLAKENE